MSICEEAQAIIDGERHEQYGDMHDSFKRIALLWSAYLDASLNEFDVAKLMILLKVSRARDTNHRDSFVDIVGYVECIDRMLQGV